MTRILPFALLALFLAIPVTSAQDQGTQAHEDTTQLSAVFALHTAMMADATLHARMQEDMQLHAAMTALMPDATADESGESMESMDYGDPVATLHSIQEFLSTLPAEESEARVARFVDAHQAMIADPEVNAIVMADPELTRLAAAAFGEDELDG